MSRILVTSSRLAGLIASFTIALILFPQVRISSCFIFVLAVGAVVAAPHSTLFMKWFGNQKGGGAMSFLESRITGIMGACLLFTLFMSCSLKDEATTIDKNKKIADLYFNEVWNKGNVDILDSLLTKDYINHTPSAPTVPGPNGLKPIVVAIRKAFPDLHFDIKEVIATEEYITIRTVMTGTQKDTLFGILPTGKHIEVNQINIEKLKNGRISEHWRVTDELTMMKQLGQVR